MTNQTSPQTRHAQLSELFRELDHSQNGNLYLAWYAQLRAEEYSHTQALSMTLDRFYIRDTDWWRARQEQRLGWSVSRDRLKQ